MGFLLPCTILMPQHGDYDQKTVKWFCNRWINKKQWLEFHGYSPISTNIESDEDDAVESK